MKQLEIVIFAIMLDFLGFSIFGKQANGVSRSQIPGDHDGDVGVMSSRKLTPNYEKYNKFYSFPDKNKPKASRLITIGSKESLLSSGLVPGQTVKIITHGYLGGVTENYVNRSAIPPIKSAYLANNFNNIICVDWSKLAKPTLPEPNLQYSDFLSVSVVGRKLARFIEFLIQNKYASGPQMIHLIGHSLGSHISGEAGRIVFTAFGQKIHRISGLDSAGPLNPYPLQPKLTKFDAQFVDCIHTNIELLVSPKSLGHVDFFPNGGIGKKQPGCEDLTVLDVSHLFDGLTCGHFKSWKYYARSIAGEKLIGCRCMKNPYELFAAQCSTTVDGTCWKPVLYGEFGSEKARGDYYITVKD